MNDSNQLTTINQNAKLALVKSKNLLDITKKILDKKELIQNFQFKPFFLEKGHPNCVTSIVVSPNGKYVVSGGSDTTIKIWDIETGECLKTIEANFRYEDFIIVSNDTKFIVSTCDKKIIKVWNIETGACYATIKVDNDNHINLLKFSPDSRYIVAVIFESFYEENYIKIWDIEYNTNFYKLARCSNYINTLYITQNSKYVIFETDDFIDIWDIHTYNRLNTFDGYILAVTLDSKNIISKQEKNIKIFDIKTGVCLNTIDANFSIKNYKDSIIVSNDTKFIVSTYDRKIIKVFNMKTGICYTEIEVNDYIELLKISSDNKYIIAVIFEGLHNENYIKVWDLETGECLGSIENYNKVSRFLEITPDGKCIVFISNDNDIKIWDIKKDAYIITFNNYIASTNSFIITPDAKYLICENNDNTVKILDIENIELLNTYDGNNCRIDSVIINSEGKYIASNSYNCETIVWEIESGKCLKNFEIFSYETSAFSTMTSDGKYIAYCGNNHYDDYDEEQISSTIYIEDLITGKYINSIEYYLESRYPLSSLVISQDGKYVISGGYDNAIRIWDILTSECIATLNGHSDTIKSLAITPNGKHVISGSDDNTIKKWDFSTGKCLMTLDDYGKNIQSIVANNNIIVFINDFGIVRILDFKTGSLLYTIDANCGIIMDKNGYFKASDENIDKYLRVREIPLSQRKLTQEEINHFRKKGDFLEVSEIIEKSEIHQSISEIEIDEDEIPY